MSLQLAGALLTVAALLFALTRTGVHYAFMAVAAHSYPVIDRVEQRIYIPSSHEAFTRLQVESAIGQLTVAPGATEILSGTAVYNVAQFAPTIHTDLDGDRSQVLMRQPRDLDPTRLISMGERFNRWDLRAGTAVPFQSLSIFLGAGLGTLDLAGVTARQVEVFLGTGEMHLSANGAPFAADGLALFVGSGKAHVDLRHSESLSTTIEMGMGEIVLDLRSDWQQDGAVLINQGLGNITLILPDEVGVRVHVNGVGDTIARGISRPPASDEIEKGVYVNAAYATSPVKVEVTVERGLGNVSLLMNMPQ